MCFFECSSHKSGLRTETFIELSTARGKTLVSSIETIWTWNKWINENKINERERRIAKIFTNKKKTTDRFSLRRKPKRMLAFRGETS